MRYSPRIFHGDGFMDDLETEWCVWDSETGAPAEAHGFRYINLRRDEAEDDAETLNNPE